MHEKGRSVSLRDFLGDEFFGHCGCYLLAIVVQHAKESVVGVGVGLVVPFLGVVDDALVFVGLDREQRIDGLERSVILLV